MSEFKDHTPDQKKVLQAFEKAWEISREFVEPYWEVAGRLYQLFRGQLPEELDSTYTKVNLNLAHGSVQERLPKKAQAVFSNRELVSLQATTPEMEIYVDQAQMWLRDLLINKLNMRYSIIPTLQDVEIMGTGYRRPCLVYQNNQPIITTRTVDFFQCLPAPNGGLVNPHDYSPEDAVDHVFYVEWPTEDYIKQQAEKGRFDKNEVGKLLKREADNENWIDSTYRDQFTRIVGGVVYDGPSTWRAKMLGQEGLKHRRRVVHWEERDRLRIIAEDQFILYDGKPKILDGTIPIAKYTAIRDQRNWFGISTLEMTEDIILAVMLNLNLRLQHLMQAMFPIKWIRDDIAQRHPGSQFDNEPGSVYPFPSDVEDIRKAIHYDRAQDAPAQAFQEDMILRYFLQETGGVKNYSKGMGGGGTLSNETASGILSIMQEANTRIMAEAEQTEYGGLRDECKLLLALGNRYVTKPSVVRNPLSQDAFPWARVLPDAISDSLEVVTHGTAELTARHETVQKLLAFMPMLINQPQAVNVPEVMRQGVEIMDVFPEPEKIVISAPMPPALGAGQGSLPGIGGMASAQDMGQQTRSTENRNTVEAGTGETVSAGYAV